VCVCVCVCKVTLESRVLEMTTKMASMQQQIERLSNDRKGYKVYSLRTFISVYVCLSVCLPDCLLVCLFVCRRLLRDLPISPRKHRYLRLPLTPPFALNFSI